MERHTRSGSIGGRKSHFLGASIVVALLTGCSAIHSEAVRDLIEKEDEKITAATTAANAFVGNTEQRVVNLERALADADKALQIQKTEEAKHALIFSSNQNLSSKKGVDAYAIAYLIGLIYLSEELGLDAQVKDQFKEDFATLKKLSNDIVKSWASIAELNKQVSSYSKQSSFASIDSEFVTAMIQETNIDTSALDDVIDRSRKVNAALKQAIAKDIGGSGTAASSQALGDLVKLLESVK